MKLPSLAIVVLLSFHAVASNYTEDIKTKKVHRQNIENPWWNKGSFKSKMKHSNLKENQRLIRKKRSNVAHIRENKKRFRERMAESLDRTVIKRLDNAKRSATATVQSCIERSLTWNDVSTMPNRVINHRALRVENLRSGVIYEHDSDKTFEVMSITKTFTATVINQLLNEGKIKHYDSFTEYLPSSVSTRNWCDRGYVNDISIRRLLNHRSGFQDIWATSPSKTAFYNDWDRDEPDRVWRPIEILDYMQGLYNRCDRDDFLYADTNYLILGLIIEHVTGNTLAHEIRTRILNPLNMRNTFMLHFEQPDGTPVRNSCGAQNSHWVGDGWCDGNSWYNTPECGFDEGDCCTYKCDQANTCNRGSRTSCVVDKPFTNEGHFSTGDRSYTADWGGSGYVSTAQDLATFIKAWRYNPSNLFCPSSSHCRMISTQMQIDWNEEDEYGYAMGIEMAFMNQGHFIYGHTGLNNAFMFYGGPSGIILTGTLNWYGGNDGDDEKSWALMDEIIDCIPTNSDEDWMPCQGHNEEGYLDTGIKCARACNVWIQVADNYPFNVCHNECMSDAGNDDEWSDEYVTCLDRNTECTARGSKIDDGMCEYEDEGCPEQCANQNQWTCIPQCEATYQN